MGTRISYHFMDIDIVEYYVGNKNVAKGCAIKAATHETFDHFFWPAEYNVKLCLTNNIQL